MASRDAPARRRLAACCAAAALLAAGCTAQGGASERAQREAAPATSAPTPTPSPTPTRAPWGPSTAHLEQAEAAVAGMDDARLAGQVIVGRWYGSTPEEASALVRDLHLGGLLHQTGNIVDVEQIRGVATAMHEAVRADGRPWPALVAVDQEGGLIARVPEPVTQMPTFLTFGSAGDPAVAESVAAASGGELRGLGFTLVLAPTADVTAGPTDPTIGSRSAGATPAAVTPAVTGALDGYRRAGVVGVAKHYPGHGSADGDSHVAMPVVASDLATLERQDLPPFRAAVEDGASAVMVGHMDVRAIDPGRPASMSPLVVQHLRQEVGFEGVIVSDSLGMGAITVGRDWNLAVVDVLAAGVDLLLMPADLPGAHAAVVAALADGRLDRDKVRKSAARVVALALHQAELAAGAGPAPSPGSGHPAAVAASSAGLVVAEGPCTGPLVGDRVSVSGGLERDRERFAAAAEAAGLRVGGGGAAVRLLGGSDTVGSGDVVVALDAPYGLGLSTATTAKLALQGRTRAAFEALVAVLTGRATGGGRLTVPVEGLPPGAGCP